MLIRKRLPIREAVLSTGRRPDSHVFPFSPQSLNSCYHLIFVFLNHLSDSLVAIIKTVGLVAISHAVSVNNILNRIGVVGRLNDEHWGFEVVGKVGSGVAGQRVIFVGLYAFWNRKSF